MKRIELTKGNFAIVSNADFAYLNQFNWWTLSSGSGPDYAARKVFISPKKWRVVLMHREILGASDMQKVDHKNGDGFDNQRHNLRIATNTQNSQGFHVKTAGTTSQYRGVHETPNGRWKAQISVNKIVKYLGRFDDEQDAARAYDAAAIKFFGDFASLNFK